MTDRTHGPDSGRKEETMDKLIFSQLNLQLFADGASAGDGGDGGNGGNGGEGTGVTAEAAAPQGKKGVKNPLADVRYGIQEEAPAAEVQKQEEKKQEPDKEQPDREKEFQKLIKGEYKDLYDKNMQDILRQRLKGTKETSDRLSALTPALELLGKKYGVDPTDTGALSKAIADDDSFYADEAMDKGMDVGTFKQLRQMEAANARMRSQLARQEQLQQAQQQYDKWQQQAEEAKLTYPGLDLKQECQNDKFMELLKAGVDVGSAYLVLHKDDIIPAAMQHAAKTVSEKLSGRMMAGNNRPSENGTGSSGAVITKTDVTKLTKADRKEICRRAALGEKIRF